MTSQDLDTKYMIDLIGGPSKFDLMVSLFDGNKEPRRTVSFLLETEFLSTKVIPSRIEVAILGVEQEDGSGESWNIRGSLWEKGQPHYPIHGHFSSSARKGWIKFEVPSHQRWIQQSSCYETVIEHDLEAKMALYIKSLRD